MAKGVSGRGGLALLLAMGAAAACGGSSSNDGNGGTGGAAVGSGGTGGLGTGGALTGGTGGLVGTGGATAGTGGAIAGTGGMAGSAATGGSGLSAGMGGLDASADAGGTGGVLDAGSDAADAAFDASSDASPDAPLDAGADGPAPDASDAASDAGATDGGSGVVATLNDPCSDLAALACSSNAQKLLLLCNGTQWVANGVCSGDFNCDTTPGPNAGSCQPIVTECLGRIPLSHYCTGADLGGRNQCGPDLVTEFAADCSGSLPVCLAGDCVECTPTEIDCLGNTPRLCDSSGFWMNEPDCTPDTPLCSAGVCKVVEITGALDSTDPGRYEDGTVARSCADYRNPATGYAYSGSTGDGVYTIDIGGFGSTLDVYCNMTADGGGWTLLATISGSDADSWNSQFGNWISPTTLGSVASPWEDYKSQAWLDLDISSAEVMLQRRFDGQIRAQTVLGNACLNGQTRFVNLFSPPNTDTACSPADIRVVTSSPTGLASASYEEGTGANGLGNAATNGFCWNGGDTVGNAFEGHLVWNQTAGAPNCLQSGHLGGIAVFISSSTQFTSADITGTNWLNGTDFTKTDISLFAR